MNIGVVVRKPRAQAPAAAPEAPRDTFSFDPPPRAVGALAFTPPELAAMGKSSGQPWTYPRTPRARRHQVAAPRRVPG